MPAGIKAIKPIPARAGIGLRAEHYAAVLETQPDVAFLEIHSENYFSDGPPRYYLEQLRSRYSMSFHGVGLSLGSFEALDHAHLAQLKQLIDRYQPELVSEHLSWSRLDGRYFNDLFPLPYTEESLRHLICRIQETQDFIGRPILVENISSYLEFAASDIPEWEFAREVARASGCGILLDINNIYVNACNHGFDPALFIDAMHAHAVGEIHLAGHSHRVVDGVDWLVDTHDSAVCDEVWLLYHKALTHLGAKPTLIEWDAQLPPLQELVQEAGKANRIMHRVEHTHDCLA